MLVKDEALADGTYELVPESESEQREAQVNLTEISEDLNQSSEELKASSAQEASLGACPTYFKFMQLFISLFYLCI